MSATTILIISILVFVAGILVGYFGNGFFKSSKNDQITTIKHVLLYLVAQAEKELSNGTGDLKLAKVYNEFVAEYPDLAKVITYEQFKVIVDDVLDNFKNLLNNNDIASYIKGDEK